ncbi:MAG TPA: hypothetical protein RMH85_00460 [Polyangiaceae bacterium LLY-WYZ-15_(1-7)]|nr:hypothetical protein [Myxococcales bacterium]MAT23962.1 hypothetical protein [Sandaracinus sp.]HJK95477.1 hypothetical protein [Polyangiaceae bacterium LLY-WYZ-15_(1-7)]HJL05605.1 hypothetical protein [Polyangiaceae bacterium LLY-WYZ-15_(1-7)]HJL06931.1 hypothetical protein [Polyangiaceae bacterium LLY-WYZ-15_(1-7)]
MTKHVLTVALVAALVGCGGNDQQQQQQAEQQANELGNALAEAMNMAAEQAGMQAQQAQQQAQQAAAAAGTSNFGTVTLTPGFTPDPHTATGTSGGATNAATLNPSCAGWVASTPDHLFVASGAFSNLRIMAKSDGDVTLVVQKPDGSYACNDDFEGMNPLVSGSFPAGTYKVWIGSYQQGTNSRYTLGFSELDSVTPSSLGG